MSEYHLSHLDELEAEAIHIMREVVAEFENPVMLYSVGKDSSVMVRLAQKAFAPGKLPFPLLHVDTGYKFAEMYEFRDRFCKEHRRESHRRRQREAARPKAPTPSTWAPPVLRLAQDQGACSTRSRAASTTRPSAARAATRRSRAPKSGSTPFATSSVTGTQRTSAPSCGTSTTATTTRARTSASFRSPTGPSSTFGSTSTKKRYRSCRCTSPKSDR